MNSKIPVFKKKVNDFLTCEEGKITKRSMLLAGGILGAAVVGGLATKQVVAGANEGCCVPSCSTTSAEGYTAPTCQTGLGSGACIDTNPGHCYSHYNSTDNYNLNETTGKFSASHNHHYNHGSHASHGSHSNY